MSKRKLSSKAIGAGLGKGHGSNTVNLPVIRPVANPITTAPIFADSSPKAYKAGKLTILHTYNDRLGHVLSIAHPDRYPTWDEVAYVRYALIPDEVTMAMLLPSREDYINMHNFCFILNEFREWAGAGLL